MSYQQKPLLKLFGYENNSFVLKAIIDDYESCSFQRNKYEAGTFTIQINYNIPNAKLFEEGLFVQFGKDSKDFGLIKNISDSIGSDGKGSQIRQIIGYDARIIFKQRVIKNLNFGDSWTYTGSGELCMRNLINSQCGTEAEEKRRLPIINNIGETGIGSDYTVSEAFSNLYDVLVTIATQTEIGWYIEFSNNEMTLKFYPGVDRSRTVRFDTDYNSLSDGTFEDSSENYANSVYVGGKGSGENRDIYEGETGEISPSGLDRYEAFDDASSLENDNEYENEAKSKLNEYSQTISLSGNGLAKCPYEYKKEYDVGDIITVAFSGKSAIAQILSVTEHWSHGQYEINFEFGKPIQDLNRQLNYLLSKIQTYQATADSVKKSNIKYYTIPTDTQMPNKDVILDVIGFIGNIGSSNKTFKLYFDNESKVGAKTYHVYFKQLSGTGKLTLTTGVSGATNLTFSGGTYVAIIYVDADGNIGKVAGVSNYNDLENKPVVDTTYSGTSTNAQSGTAVASALSSKNDVITITDDSSSTLNDDSRFMTASGSGVYPYTNHTSFLARKLSQLWNYIKCKIGSNSKEVSNKVLGTVNTATSSIDDNSQFAFHYVTPSDTTGAIYTRTANYIWNYIKSKLFPLNIGVDYNSATGTFHQVKQLTNSSGTWKKFVILLGKTVNDDTTISSNLQWDLKGSLMSERPSGHYHASIEFNAYSGYSWGWETGGSIDTCYGSNAGITYDIGTCVYGGQRYVCLIGFANIQLTRTMWNIMGDCQSATNKPFENLGLMINYQTRESSTASWGVVNQEINDSVTPFSGTHRAKWTREANITGSSATATKATQDGSGNVITSTYQAKVAKLGSTSKPVYTSAVGTFAECSSYAGGTAVTLNGINKSASTASFYAPTSAGTSGQILQNVKGTLTWIDSSFAYSGVCETAKNNATKEVVIRGFTSVEGMKITVLFKYGNSENTPKLAIRNPLTNVTTTYNIKIVRGGTKYLLGSTESTTSIKALKSGKWRGATSATNEMWQPNTILELIYDGTDLVIMGNPEVESWSDANGGYSVKANGLIEQWGESPKRSTSNNQTTVNFAVEFSDTTYASSAIMYNNADANIVFTSIRVKTKSSFDVRYWYSTGYGSTNLPFDWMVKGY